jgi:hypothetical protein
MRWRYGQLTVNRSASWRNDLLDPANRQSRERTNAAMAHASVTRDDKRIVVQYQEVSVRGSILYSILPKQMQQALQRVCF